MSFRLSVHQFFVGQKEITTNHFAPKIQLFTKANFSEKDVWEFRPHRTRGAPWALKDRLHRLWKIGHPRWWYWWRFGISREWTCTDVRKVPSDCDVDDDDVDDDPRTPQVLSRVRYQRSKPNLSTFLQKVLPPISEIEPNQISILYYIQHRWIIDEHMERTWGVLVAMDE